MTINISDFSFPKPSKIAQNFNIIKNALFKTSKNEALKERVNIELNTYSVINNECYIHPLWRGFSPTNTHKKVVSAEQIVISLLYWKLNDFPKAPTLTETAQFCLQLWMVGRHEPEATKDRPNAPKNQVPHEVRHVSHRKYNSHTFL